MEPTPKPHVSHWIAWSMIILAVGLVFFFGWRYFDEITTIYDNTLVSSNKSKTTAPAATTTTTTTTTATTASWLTYTNKTYGYSIQYPKELSYKESTDLKNVYFQTAKEKTAAEACATRVDTDCPLGGEIYIDVDANVGTTNEDDITAPLKEIVDTRVSRMALSASPVATTLGGQSAYEGLNSVLVSRYNLITKYKGSIYDLTIGCGEVETLAKCKAVITADQQKMIDSFTFTK